MQEAGKAKKWDENKKYMEYVATSYLPCHVIRENYPSPSCYFHWERYLPTVCNPNKCPLHYLSFFYLYLRKCYICVLQPSTTLLDFWGGILLQRTAFSSRLYHHHNVMGEMEFHFRSAMSNLQPSAMWATKSNLAAHWHGLLEIGGR